MAAMFVNKVTRGEMEGQTLGQVNSERKRKLSRLALAPAKLAVLPFQVRFSPLADVGVPLVRFSNSCAPSSAELLLGPSLFGIGPRFTELVLLKF